MRRKKNIRKSIYYINGITLRGSWLTATIIPLIYILFLSIAHHVKIEKKSKSAESKSDYKPPRWWKYSLAISYTCHQSPRSILDLVLVSLMCRRSSYSHSLLQQLFFPPFCGFWFFPAASLLLQLYCPFYLLWQDLTAHQSSTVRDQRTARETSKDIGCRGTCARSWLIFSYTDSNLIAFAIYTDYIGYHL